MAQILSLARGLPGMSGSMSGRVPVTDVIQAIFVTPGLSMRMTIGKPIPTEGMRSADRTELTHRLEEAVRASFTTEV